MKKYFLLKTGVLFTILFMFSCEDNLDITQPGELNPETTFRTVNDLQLYLNGDIYNNVNSSSEIGLTSVFTDEVAEGINYNGRDAVLRQYFLDVDNSQTGAIWARQHRLINRVNILLENAQSIAPSEDEVEQYNDILAQARTYRAWALLKVISYFSPDMTSDEALGGILFTNVPAVGDQLPRSTNGEIYQQIIDDLEFAEQNLSPSATSEFRVTQSFIDGIRARMYAYRNDYANARTFAQRVINNSGLSLATGVTYTQMWQDTNRGEVIFSMQRPEGGGGSNIGSLWFFNSTDINGSVVWSMGINQYLALTQISGDPRATAFVDETSDLLNNVYVINKYPGLPTDPLKNNLKEMRLSEMYFILAEADVSDNNLTSAANRMQEFRTSRIGTNQPLPSYSNAQQAWADILLERRREFAFEGHRYIDLRRMGERAGRSIDRNAQDDATNASLTLPVNDHRFTLPIPIAELQGNPQIQQNPNYSEG